MLMRAKALYYVYDKEETFSDISNYQIDNKYRTCYRRYINLGMGAARRGSTDMGRYFTSASRYRRTTGPLTGTQ